MPGREHLTARLRVAESVMPEVPEVTRSAGAPPAPRVDTDRGTGAPSSRSLASRTNRPIVAALTAALAALAFTLARLLTWAHGNIGRFILVGRYHSNPAQVPHGIPVARTWGYDGQYFYRLALSPLNLSHTAYGISMDSPYRFMRIGYPAITWLVSFGQHSLVPLMLVAVNIAAIGALGYLGALFAAASGRHALAGLLLPGYFGLITSLARDTAEPLAAACLVAGLLALRRRRPVLAAALLAFGALTRETVMVAVAAIAIVRVIGILRNQRRLGREDLAWAVPAVVFAAWQVAVKAATGSFPLRADGGKNAGAPFVAPLEALQHNIEHLSGQHFNLFDLWFLEFAVLAVFVIAALLSLWSTNAPVHERLAFVLFLIEICIVTPSTWNSLASDLRTFVDVYLLAVIILLGTPRRRLGAWLPPSLAALAVPALVVVAQHRLTLS